MNRLTRKFTLAAAAASTLAGLGTGTALAATAGSATSAVRASAALPQCQPQNLAASLHGAQTAPHNVVGLILTLSNEGNRSCSLYGYPGLGLEGWNHNTLPSHTFWGSTYFDRDPGRHLIVLSPGETASASLAFVTGSNRGAVQAAYLVVTPPNDYAHLVVGPFSRSMTVPIYHGDLYVTAMAYHTPHP